MGSGGSVDQMSENERFVHQFDEMGFDCENVCLEAEKIHYNSIRILTSQTSSSSIPLDDEEDTLDPQQDEDATLIEHFKDVDSPVKYEDFFFKLRSNTISTEEARKYIEDFPDALFATDCCGCTPVDYAHKNKNNQLCVFLIHTKFTIAKQRVLDC